MNLQLHSSKVLRKISLYHGKNHPSVCHFADDFGPKTIKIPWIFSRFGKGSPSYKGSSSGLSEHHLQGELIHVGRMFGQRQLVTVPQKFPKLLDHGFGDWLYDVILCSYSTFVGYWFAFYGNHFGSPLPRYIISPGPMPVQKIKSIKTPGVGGPKPKHFSCLKSSPSH